MKQFTLPLILIMGTWLAGCWGGDIVVTPQMVLEDMGGAWDEQDTETNTANSVLYILTSQGTYQMEITDPLDPGPPVVLKGRIRIDPESMVIELLDDLGLSFTYTLEENVLTLVAEEGTLVYHRRIVSL